MASKRFRAEVTPFGPALAIDLPPDVLEFLGGKRVPVKVTINKATFETTTAVMQGRHVVGLSKERRALTGVEPGDVVTVTIARDDAPRQVPVPDDLAAALRRNRAAATRFDGLAPSHRKEWVRWIEEAKKPETRERRVTKTVEDLAAGKRSRT